MVRVAVVGLGFMGKTHLGIYAGLPNVEVGALCDIRREVLEAGGPDTGGNIQTAAADLDLTRIRTFAEYEALIDEGGFDVVDLCVPTHLHVDYAVSALERGYDVFCEKPLTLDLESARRMTAVAANSDRLCAVGQCLRHWPVYVEMKSLVESGRYGAVRFAEFSRFSSPPTWSWDDWLLDPSRSGDAALDLHVHDVDTILNFFGLPTSVRSQGSVDSSSGISHISTVYGYPGKSVMSTGGWRCSSSFGFNMRAMLVLERATVEMDFSRQPVCTVYPEDGEKYPLPFGDGDGYYHELVGFVDAVEKRDPSRLVTVDAAADSVRVALAEIQSVRENREIVL